MVEPVRKMPADWEPETAPESADPFRYGWRPRFVRLPGGKLTEEQIPLTLEDLLDPQPGDVVVQSDPHFDLLFAVADILRRRYASQEDVHVGSDLKMMWGIPKLPRPCPDVVVIPGVRRKHDSKRNVFDVREEGAHPCLVIEVVSATDSKIRKMDYEDKVEIYERAGVPEYLILDPATPVTQERLLLTGYRLGVDRRYRQIEPDPQGRILSETTSLLFGVAEDGRTIQIFDTATGERLLSAAELEAELKRLKRSQDGTRSSPVEGA
jgi:colicin import membrane protein